jgi:DNA-binding NarL/FixJ family response regulator
VRSIHHVDQGDGTLSPSVARRLIAMIAGDAEAGTRREGARRRLAQLSPRERDVALAIGRGHPNADIARELHISVGTVKSHITALLSKLQVDNRVQIALLVQEANALPG